ncbi:MAG: invasion associated locus B family protein [Alphaproteobacteria bacterium]|nr:invasion associated locus B family protein [Alphaproteobacteria bacterium]
MKRFLKWSLLALSATFTTNGALAQDASSTEVFPIGKAPEVQPGQTYAKEVFGDWELLCVKTAEGPEPCEIGQLILDGNSNPIADVRIFPLPPGNAAIAGATFINPLGVALASGMIFGVDDKETKQYPYQFCTSVGCIARVGFTPLELQALRKGENGKMTFRMMNSGDQQVTVNVSLKGFATGYAELTRLRLQAAKLTP